MSHRYRSFGGSKELQHYAGKNLKLKYTYTYMCLRVHVFVRAYERVCVQNPTKVVRRDKMLYLSIWE